MYLTQILFGISIFLGISTAVVGRNDIETNHRNQKHPILNILIVLYTAVVVIISIGVIATNI